MTSAMLFEMTGNLLSLQKQRTFVSSALYQAKAAIAGAPSEFETARAVSVMHAREGCSIVFAYEAQTSSASTHQLLCLCFPVVLFVVLVPFTLLVFPVFLAALVFPHDA